MPRRSPALLLGLIGLLTGCRETPEAIAAQKKAIVSARAKALEQRLASVDADADHTRPVAVWVMPVGLREISGIALLPDGELLAHGDEQAQVYVLDPRTGIVAERFDVGRAMHGDFEAITTAGEDIWLLESDGKLYQFKRGKNNGHVKYKKLDTKLGKECEFEGLAYQPDSAWLLMPCKRTQKKSLKGQLVIYRFRLNGPDEGKISELSVPLDEVISENKWKDFRPSDITIDPTTGNYVLISAQENGLVVMTPEGQVVRSERLPGTHQQAEGVAITSDNILILSDEARNLPASITLYRWRP